MNLFVLDASVALRWFLDKFVPPYATRVKRLLLEGTRALVPGLWHLEIANGLLVAERCGRLQAAEVAEAFRNVEQLLTVAIETDLTLISARQTYNRARSVQLSAYDASYLNLAEREGLPLATLDEQLSAAARRSGVAIV